MSHLNHSLKQLSTQNDRHYKPLNSFQENRSTILVMAAKGAGSLPEYLRVELEKQGTVTYVSILKPLSDAEFIRIAKPFNFIAITRRAIQKLNRNVISALPDLKGMSVYSTGTEWIDIHYLKQRKIVLTTLPDYCTNAVAEVALGLILMASHRLHLRYGKTIGTVPEYVSVRGKELQNAGVGIIGYGKTGRTLAQKVQPLCCQVTICDQLPVTRLSSGLINAPIGELIKSPDWIVCCASQDFAEKSIMLPHEYQLFDPQKILINVGRKSLFDHAILMEMVENNKLGGYIFDDLLTEGENPDKNVFGKIIPQGHTAWYTDEAMEQGTHNWIVQLIHLIKDHSLCTRQEEF